MGRTDQSADATAKAHASRRHVAIGDYAITDTGCELITYGLGSCLGVALVDSAAGVAGLAHIKRPTTFKRPNTSGQQATTDAVFADTGIRLLFGEMRSCGATRRHTVAKLAGGIGMDASRPAVGTGIGRRNIEQARDTLATLDITVAGTDVGGTAVRSVFLDGSTGVLTIETTGGDRETI
jgi:chemotaxis protein CheD